MQGLWGRGRWKDHAPEESIVGMLLARPNICGRGFQLKTFFHFLGFNNYLFSLIHDWIQRILTKAKQWIHHHHHHHHHQSIFQLPTPPLKIGDV